MSPKGEYPFNLNGDGTLKDDTERRHWRAFWDEFPGWFRTAIIALSSAGVSAFSMKHMGMPPPSILMDEDDYRKVVQEEIGPLKAGFKAFVATQPDKVQVLVFRAMDRKQEHEREK